jgi:dTDP-4-dehydrorhamnose reductase
MLYYFSFRVAEGLHKLDLTNSPEVEKAIAHFKPNFLIHCAAQRFPEKVDLDPEGAAKINVDSSRHLAQIAGMNAVFIIYFQKKIFMLVAAILPGFNSWFS